MDETISMSNDETPVDGLEAEADAILANLASEGPG